MVNKEDHQTNPHPQALTIITTKAEEQHGGQEAPRWDSSCNNDGGHKVDSVAPLALTAFKKSFIEVGQTTKKVLSPGLIPCIIPRSDPSDDFRPS